MYIFSTFSVQTISAAAVPGFYGGNRALKSIGTRFSQVTVRAPDRA